MEESPRVSSAETGEQSMQLLTLSHAHGDQRAGAGEQNGSSEAKKQSSSSQAETNLAEEQQRSLTRNSTEMPSGGPSGGLKKSSSSGSIPCSNSQRHQSRSVRKTVSRFDEVQERRLQLEEKRQEALKKQISEKEKRRQRALELKGSKQPSTRITTRRRVTETPSIVVESASPEPKDRPTKSMPKPEPILIIPAERVTSPKCGTPTSPRSPKSPKTMTAKPGEPKRIPPQVGMPRKTSPVQKPPSKPTQAKKTVFPTKRLIRKEKKQKEVPSIPEVVEPTGSEDGSTTDEKVDSYSELSSYSIYYNEPKPGERFSVSSEVDNLITQEGTPHQRRLTLQEGHSEHAGERKSSHPNIKFPEKVEFTEKPCSQFIVTSQEYERRRRREYKPKTSAVAFMGSMRSGTETLEQVPANNTPTSAPVSRVTTPNASRSSSPQRHLSAVVQPTSSKTSPLLQRRTSNGKEPPAGPSTDTTPQLDNIYSPPLDQPAMGIRRLASIEKKFGEEKEEPLEVITDVDEEARLSSAEFPASCSEMRPQEACLYAIMHEGTTLETEVFKMALTDEQVDKVSEIYSLPNSLVQFLLIVPKVQEYLDEGVTTFKILSATEADGSRSSYIIYSSAGPLSGSSSSTSSAVSLSNFDF